MKTFDEAVEQLNKMTSLFRLHVKERDMDKEDISTLINAEAYTESVLRPIFTMQKGKIVNADGTTITEPNKVTALLHIAEKIGMKIRVPNPDADVLPDGNFDYHEWTTSSREAWNQLIAMYMAVDEDFNIEFQDEDNKHVHWIKIVPYGGNTPDDGWLNDSCTCEIMYTLWK